jgi:hypothetical protein
MIHSIPSIFYNISLLLVPFNTQILYVEGKARRQPIKVRNSILYNHSTGNNPWSRVRLYNSQNVVEPTEVSVAKREFKKTEAKYKFGNWTHLLVFCSETIVTTSGYKTQSSVPFDSAAHS